MSSYKSINDFIIFKKITKKEKKEGEFYIPATANTKIERGEVISVPKDEKDIKVRNKIIYKNGEDILIDSVEELSAISKEDIIAIIK